MGDVKLSLEAARINKKLTQAEAGELIGVTGRTICSWEKGTSLPNARQIQIIESVYGVPYHMLNFMPY